jgi:hypothetical protein
LTRAEPGCYNDLTRQEIHAMRPLVCSLLLLVLTGAAVQSAPAPFAQTPRPGDNLPSVEWLKDYLLRTSGFHADSIQATAQPGEWLVMGNTPLVSDDARLMYSQRVYRVKVSGSMRRGNVEVAVTILTPPRKVITR